MEKKGLCLILPSLHLHSNPPQVLVTVTIKSKLIIYAAYDYDGDDVFVYQWNWNGSDGPVDDPLLGDIMSPSDNLNGASENRQNRKHIPQKQKLNTK